MCPYLKKKTECVVKTHDRSETFVLQGNIVIIHQSRISIMNQPLLFTCCATRFVGCLPLKNLLLIAFINFL
jgi:ABC-type Fe3+/spermidine/putrescine transport system ATPase subunit